jgi:hypothetical protein
MIKSTWTITFSESVENHVGMQIVGNKALSGFTVEELANIRDECRERGYTTKLYNLESKLPDKYQTDNTEASILIIKNGIELLLDENEKKHKKFNKEIFALKNIVDKKAFMYGRVINKKARWNLCFADEAQEPDYENKKGRVVAFEDVPYLNRIRKNLPKIVGKKGKNMFAELNYYYDIQKCFIGWHSDIERRRVIGLRLGEKFPLYFQWYYKKVTIGERVKLILENGDVYIMSEKTVGTDGRKKNIPTLRHAAFLENNKFVKKSKKDSDSN